MVWKRYTALRGHLLENKPFLKQIAEAKTKKRKSILHQATVPQLKIIRDLIQKVYLKKRIPIPKKIYKKHKKSLSYLVLKLKGHKLHKRKQLQKIFNHTLDVLPHLIKSILKNG